MKWWGETFGKGPALPGRRKATELSNKVNNLEHKQVHKAHKKYIALSASKVDQGTVSREHTTMADESTYAEKLLYHAGFEFQPRGGERLDLSSIAKLDVDQVRDMCV